jgi:hypothetical protein
LVTNTKRGYCSTHNTQWNKFGAVRPVKFSRPAPGGKCEICNVQIPEGRRRKVCSKACAQRKSRHRGERPKVTDCLGCGVEISLIVRRQDGRLRRSDKKWCNDCADGKVRRRVYKYDILPEQYAAANARGCEICRRTDVNVHVDHDHDCCPGDYTCGKCIRGFLCGSCNRAVGLFNDNIEIILAAATYMQRSQNLE